MREEKCEGKKMGRKEDFHVVWFAKKIEEEEKRGVGPTAENFLSLMRRKRKRRCYIEAIDTYALNYILKYQNDNRVLIFTLNLFLFK